MPVPRKKKTVSIITRHATSAYTSFTRNRQIGTAVLIRKVLQKLLRQKNVAGTLLAISR